MCSDALLDMILRSLPFPPFLPDFATSLPPRTYVPSRKHTRHLTTGAVGTTFPIPTIWRALTLTLTPTAGPAKFGIPTLSIVRPTKLACNNGVEAEEATLAEGREIVIFAHNLATVELEPIPRSSPRYRAGRGHPCQVSGGI